MTDLKHLLYRYNPWWEGGFKLSGIIRREKYLDLLMKSCNFSQIVILTGLRRIGKTTLMRMVIQQLLDYENVKASHIFYVSLDDYSLRGKSILEIVEQYYQFHRIRSDENVFLFFDEVTATADYEIQLKNLYDRGNVKIFASSSSASILKQGKALMTGRKQLIEVLPLSFEEYMMFKGINIKIADSHLLPVYFEDYMKAGGIPEYVLTGNIDYIRELVDDIICKDIAAVHGIKQLGILRDYFMLLMERAGKAVSINKMARVLGISPDTSRRYLELFEDTYLIHLVSRYGKLNEQLRSPKKIYAADLGMRVLFTGFRDVGSLFENYIFQLIRDQEPRYVLENGIEIDFFTRTKHLIEVKYNDELREKQKALFDSFDAEKKSEIKNIFDAERIVPARESDSYPIFQESREEYVVSRDEGVELGYYQS